MAADANLVVDDNELLRHYKGLIGRSQDFEPSIRPNADQRGGRLSSVVFIWIPNELHWVLSKLFTPYGALSTSREYTDAGRTAQSFTNPYRNSPTKMRLFSRGPSPFVCSEFCYCESKALQSFPLHSRPNTTSPAYTGKLQDVYEQIDLSNVSIARK